MTKWYRTVTLFIILPVLAVSCRQMFTTSLASGLSRDSLNISKSTSIKDLLSLSKTSSGSSPDAAKEILDALAGKTAADIAALPVSDKTAILNMASTAAIDMKTLTDLAGSATDGTNTDELINTALSAFDTSVNLDAVEAVLGDPESLATAPADSIVFASAVVMADVADEIGTDRMMDIMASGDTSSLADNPVQQARMETILNARDVLNSRPEEETDVSISGFNLNDILQGTQS